MGSTIKNLKINLKLYLLAGIAILGMFLVGFISIALMGTLNHSALIIADKWMPSLYLSGEMETTLTAVRLNEQVLVMASTPEVERSNSEELAQNLSAMDSNIKAYGGYVSTTEGRGLYQTLQNAWSEYQKMDSELTGMIQQGNHEDAAVLLEGEGLTKYNAMINALSALADFNTNRTAGGNGSSSFDYAWFFHDHHSEYPSAGSGDRECRYTDGKGKSGCYHPV